MPPRPCRILISRLGVRCIRKSTCASLSVWISKVCLSPGAFAIAAGSIRTRPLPVEKSLSSVLITVPHSLQRGYTRQYSTFVRVMQYFGYPNERGNAIPSEALLRLTAFGRLTFDGGLP